MSKCLLKKIRNNDIVSVGFSPDMFKSLMNNLKSTFLEEKEEIPFTPLESEEDSLFFEGETEFENFMRTYKPMF